MLSPPSPLPTTTIFPSGWMAMSDAHSYGPPKLVLTTPSPPPNDESGTTAASRRRRSSGSTRAGGPSNADDDAGGAVARFAGIAKGPLFDVGAARTAPPPGGIIPASRTSRQRPTGR